MANHRIITPSPSWLQLVTPAYLRRLSAVRKAGLIVDLVLLGLVTPALVQHLTGHWGATLGLILGTLLHVAWSAILEGRQQFEDARRDDRDRDMMESLAVNPGGAPLMADVRSHCGCVLRYAYDGENVLWTPVGVVESVDSCLAEAR